MSKMSESIEPLKELILSGCLLSIDPSSGSYNSMPGYAIFKNGQFVDSGIIKLKAGTALHNRLFALRKTLMEDFKDIQPDVLITENIPPIMPSKGGFFNKSVMSLQKSVGVTISCFDCPLVEVAPISWRKYIPDNYKKSDTNDAMMMAICVLKVASEGEWQISPEILNRLATDSWK